MMADLEKVIKGLECCHGENAPNCNDCPYVCSNVLCRKNQIYADALELLKAQEPIAPVCFERRSTRDKYQCGNCGSSEVFKEWEYCPWCGRAVKWDG